MPRQSHAVDVTSSQTQLSQRLREAQQNGVLKSDYIVRALLDPDLDNSNGSHSLATDLNHGSNPGLIADARCQHTALHCAVFGFEAGGGNESKVFERRLDELGPGMFGAGMSKDWVVVKDGGLGVGVGGGEMSDPNRDGYGNGKSDDRVEFHNPDNEARSSTDDDQDALCFDTASLVDSIDVQIEFVRACDRRSTRPYTWPDSMFQEMAEGERELMPRNGRHRWGLKEDLLDGSVSESENEHDTWRGGTCSSSRCDWVCAGGHEQVGSAETEDMPGVKMVDLVLESTGGWGEGMRLE